MGNWQYSRNLFFRYRSGVSTERKFAIFGSAGIYVTLHSGCGRHCNAFGTSAVLFAWHVQYGSSAYSNQ